MCDSLVHYYDFDIARGVLIKKIHNDTVDGYANITKDFYF